MENPSKSQRKKKKKDVKLVKKKSTPTQIISQKVVVNVGDKAKKRGRKKVNKKPIRKDELRQQIPQFIYPSNPSFDLVGQLTPPPPPRPPIPQPTPSQLAIPEFTSPEVNEQIKASVGAREDILTKPELKVKASPTRSLLQANQDMDFNVPLEQRPPIPSLNLSKRLKELRERDAMLLLQARRDVVLPEDEEAKEPEPSPAEPSPEKRGRGRPKGAKNKPKPQAVGTQVPTPDFEPPPAEDKDTPASQHGILGDRPDQDTLLRRQSSVEISKEATKRRERKPKSAKLPAEEGQPAIATKAIPEATATPIPDPTQPPASQSFSVVVKAPSDKRTTDFVSNVLAGTTLSNLPPEQIAQYLLPKSPEKPTLEQQTLGQPDVAGAVIGSNTQEGTII
jgi:hypothetical protein